MGCRGPRRAWILVEMYRTKCGVLPYLSLTKSARLGGYPFRLSNAGLGISLLERLPGWILYVANEDSVNTTEPAREWRISLTASWHID
ncbi:hypothetical protein EAE96_011038 [Botrytis aclada]|nr:hypothetical protein EAE96_011038 [Botrytis aclada]